MWERVYPEIGNVLFVKSIRAKRLIIRISKQAEVRVTIPFFSGIKQAESFVLSKKDWICNTKNSIEQKYQKEYIISDTNFITNKHSCLLNLKMIKLEVLFAIKLFSFMCQLQ